MTTSKKLGEIIRDTSRRMTIINERDVHDITNFNREYDFRVLWYSYCTICGAVKAPNGDIKVFRDESTNSI